jgi:predicted transcriptional regulator
MPTIPTRDDRERYAHIFRLLANVNTLHIIQLINQNEKRTVKAIAQSVGSSEQWVQEQINPLIEAGILRKTESHELRVNGYCLPGTPLWYMFP